MISTLRATHALAVSRVVLVAKKDDDRAERYATNLSQWLADRGVEVVADIDHQAHLVVVLGGDGTLLHIAEQAARHSLPVLGINLGHLGFLTELTENETHQALTTIISKQEITVEQRLMIKTRLLQGEQSTSYRYALNDVVIAKHVLDRLLNLSSTVDHEYINTYRADGLIFSTPTGSTAYNLSAGGPLVYPGLATITVTPICPFMLGSRPIILPADKVIRTRLETSDTTEPAKIIIDGKALWQMQVGDEIEIALAEHPLSLVVSANRDYFAILRNKLHWGSPNNPGTPGQ